MAEAMLPPEYRAVGIGPSSEKNVVTKKNLSFASTDSLGRKCGDSFASIDSLGRRRRSSGVLFTLPSVSKRQRMVKPSDELVSRVSEGIKKAVSRSDRLSALGAACATFDHDISSTHDEEVLTYGVDAALCKHLALLFFKKKQLEESQSLDDESEYGVEPCNDEDASALDEEIGYTCMALEMVFRCTASALSESFERFGHDLLDFLLLILNRNVENVSRDQRPDKVNSWDSGKECHPSTSATQLFHIDYAIADRSRSNFSDMSLSKSTKIICHLARVGSATEPIARHPGVLRTLKNIVDFGNNQINDNNAYRHEARLNSLWILANLACAPGNMINMARYPGMLDSLLEVIERCDQVNDGMMDCPETSRSRTRSIAARGQAVRIILNLSWKDENKLLMTNMPSLVEALTKLLARGDEYAPGKGTSAICHTTRLHAVGTLRNIAAVGSSDHKIRLCRTDSLLDVLTDAAVYPRELSEHKMEQESAIRERAIAALHNICCEQTTEILGTFPGLLDVLERASNETCGEDVGDDNIRTLAERTLRVLAQYASDGMKCHSALRQVLESKEASMDVENGNDNGTKNKTTEHRSAPDENGRQREKILKHLPHLDI